MPRPAPLQARPHRRPGAHAARPDTQTQLLPCPYARLGPQAARSGPGPGPLYRTFQRCWPLRCPASGRRRPSQALPGGFTTDPHQSSHQPPWGRRQAVGTGDRHRTGPVTTARRAPTTGPQGCRWPQGHSHNNDRVAAARPPANAGTGHAGNRGGHPAARQRQGHRYRCCCCPPQAGPPYHWPRSPPPYCLARSPAAAATFARPARRASPEPSSRSHPPGPQSRTWPVALIARAIRRQPPGPTFDRPCTWHRSITIALDPDRPWLTRAAAPPAARACTSGCRLQLADSGRHLFISLSGGRRRAGHRCPGQACRTSSPRRPACPVGPINRVSPVNHQQLCPPPRVLQHRFGLCFIGHFMPCQAILPRQQQAMALTSGTGL